MRSFVWIAYHPKLLVREPTLNRSLIISKNSVEKAVAEGLGKLVRYIKVLLHTFYIGRAGEYRSLVSRFCSIHFIKAGLDNIVR